MVRDDIGLFDVSTSQEYRGGKNVPTRYKPALTLP